MSEMELLLFFTKVMSWVKFRPQVNSGEKEKFHLSDVVLTGGPTVEVVESWTVFHEHYSLGLFHLRSSGGGGLETKNKME